MLLKTAHRDPLECIGSELQLIQSKEKHKAAQDRDHPSELDLLHLRRYQLLESAVLLQDLLILLMEILLIFHFATSFILSKRIWETYCYR